MTETEKNERMYRMLARLENILIPILIAGTTIAVTYIIEVSLLLPVVQTHQNAVNMEKVTCMEAATDDIALLACNGDFDK